MADQKRSAHGLSEDESNARTLLNSKLPLLCLPGEIRNKIYGYAYNEERIAIYENRSSELVYEVQTLELSSLNRRSFYCRYPLRQLLARTTICRQIYNETRLLPLRLNSFLLSNHNAVQKLPLYGKVKELWIKSPATADSWTSRTMVERLAQLPAQTAVIGVKPSKGCTSVSEFESNRSFSLLRRLLTAAGLAEMVQLELFPHFLM
ncbi:hypothetical protein T440DRAFT_537742 [Plenodomus tracheiphilus IPT5]|uniref:Uncharacterized protein n=1 Tax=Plenodomus tracheiphilus IPT5 TaxID=1408161 RepID=A0A6A7B0K5_9PLEO|nr:hypothetical protein T440DRAFT_537742 [Plenodomus tracheiphilus IPT5]